MVARWGDPRERADALEPVRSARSLAPSSSVARSVSTELSDSDTSTPNVVPGPGGLTAFTYGEAPTQAPSSTAVLRQPPAIDWKALVAGTRSGQADSAASRVPAVVPAMASLVNDAILRAAYSGDGQNFLSQMQKSLSDAGSPALAAAAWPQLSKVSAPDFSGLSTVYAALSAQPSPIDIIGPRPQIPAAVEQAFSALPSPPDLHFPLPPPQPVPWPSITQRLGFPF